MATLLDTAIEALKEQLATPRADLEKNLRVILEELVSKMDLVSSAEFERQQMALHQARQQIDSLHQRLDVVLARLDRSTPKDVAQTPSEP